MANYLTTVFSAVGQALVNLFTFQSLLAIILASLVSFIFGIIPGLSGTTAMIIFLPFIWKINPVVGVIILLTLHAAVCVGGSITAILFNTPGTGQNVATCFDGYPLSQQGKAEYAIGASATASAVGAILGAMFLAFAAPMFRPLVLLFGLPEFFVLTMLGIISIALVSKEESIKGLIAGGLGLLISFIGTEKTTAMIRYDFGLSYFWDGVPTVIILMGFFGFCEMIRLLKEGGTIAEGDAKKSITDKKNESELNVWDGVKACWIHRFLVIRSAILGVVVGFTPGIGGQVANYLAYIQAKETSKNPETFGKGNIEGIIGPETANDAKEGGALLPTLVFGVPGSSAMALLLLGLRFTGVTPGRAMLEEGLYLVYLFVFVIVVSNIFISLFAISITPLIKKITIIPVEMVVPFIWSIGSLGIFVYRYNIYDVFLAYALGLFGYFFRKYGFPVAPLSIGVILGVLAENNFILSNKIYGPLFVFKRPMSLSIVCLISVGLCFNYFLKKKKKNKKITDKTGKNK